VTGQQSHVTSEAMGDKGLRVGVNGFGRIGRAVVRHLLNQNKHQIVHINDLNPDRQNLKYLLQYDSSYGRLNQEIGINEEGLILKNQTVSVSAVEEIEKVPWKDRGVDVIVEATGVNRNSEEAKNFLQNGIRVVITAISPAADYTLVFGVNEEGFDPHKHKFVSTSICDANACAPILKYLNQTFGIEHGFITTLHPWLSYQNLMDGPSRSQSYPGATYSHYPLGRSSIGTLIPKPTTVVSACEIVVPELANVLKCFSYRVPTNVVSTADLSLCMKKNVTETQVIEAIKVFQAGKSSFIDICYEPLISVDYISSRHSCIVDSRWIMVTGGNFLKLVLWYDNEWGYSARVVDTLDLISGQNVR